MNNQIRVKIRSTQIIQIAVILSLLLYITSIIIAWANPAATIELSIYSETPMLYWIFSTLSIIFSISIVIFSVRMIEKILAYYILLLNYLSLVSLFIIRGYHSLHLGSDAGTHYGIVLNIVQNGFINVDYYSTSFSSLHYPIRHIISAVFIKFTNIDYTVGMNIIAIILILVFLLGIVVLIYHIVPKKYHVFSYLILAMGPMSIAEPLVYTMPYIMGVLLFPIFMYVVLKLIQTTKYQNCVLVMGIILGCALTMIHGLSGIFALIFCICGAVITFVSGIMKGDSKATFPKRLRCRGIFQLTIILALFYSFWVGLYLLSSYVTTGMRIFEIIMGGAASSGSPSYDANTQLGYLDTLFQMNLGDMLAFGLLSNGYVIFGIIQFISLVSAIWTMKYVRSRDEILKMQTVLLFQIIGVIVMLFLFLGSSSMSFYRVGHYLSIFPLLSLGFAIPLIVFNVNRIKKQNALKKLFSQVLLILLISLIIITPHAFFYKSVDINGGYPGYDMMSEIDGFSFVLDKTDDEKNIYGFHYEHNLYRYSMYLWGYNIEKNMVSINIQDDINIIEHPSYMVFFMPLISYQENSLYYSYLPENKKMTSDIFLYSEDNANKIYSNPTLAVLIV